MSNSANSTWRSVCRPLWKFFAASILSNSARGSGAPVSTCAVRRLQHVPLPAEVLHELARQLDRVPFDAGDAGDAEVVDLRQHVVQAVAELVEQRDDVVVRQQRRLAADAAARSCRPGAPPASAARLRAAPSGRARRPSRRRGACRCGRRGRGRTGRPAAPSRSMRKKRTLGCQTGALSGRMRTSNSVSMIANRPSSTFGSVKYCLTSWSLKA